MIDKRLIQKRFTDSVEHYDQAAIPQKVLAERLVAWMQDLPLPEEGRALEVGCGTGLFSVQLLSLLQSRGVRYTYTFNDLSPAVERRLREKIGPNHTFLAGDAELIEWNKGYQLITSAACIQWWHSPLSFISKAYDALASGGVLAFSTFLPENLYQLTQVTHNGLAYPSHREVELALEQSGFKEVRTKESFYTLHFNGLTPLLQHLKDTGTNIARHPAEGLWTLEKIKQMEEAYRAATHLNGHEPLPLTYVALLVTARK